MPLLILLALIVAAVFWWLLGDRAANLNEKVYLRSRGYGGDDKPRGRPVSRDVRLLGLLASLDDVTANARQRAAEDIEKLCNGGQRDRRMYSPLITALDDSSPIVRKAVASALASLGDTRAVERLERLAEGDESIYVRTAARSAVRTLKGSDQNGADAPAQVD
ncbi:MAG TPA: HEAT repeat domain-containing protein [Blastocatellia bacterium]|nr:HEAT repeat domain-containing protein [Blastocatellia bacterium]